MWGPCGPICGSCVALVPLCCCLVACWLCRQELDVYTSTVRVEQGWVEACSSESVCMVGVEGRAQARAQTWGRRFKWPPEDGQGLWCEYGLVSRTMPAQQWFCTEPDSVASVWRDPNPVCLCLKVHPKGWEPSVSWSSQGLCSARAWKAGGSPCSISSGCVL